MSANSAVTVLRSPSAGAVVSAGIAMLAVSKEDGDDLAVVLLAVSVVPQSPQKRLPGGFSAPHFGQWFVSGAPQSPQNFLPAGLSLPHFEQRISSPLAQRFAPHLSPCPARCHRSMLVKPVPSRQGSRHKSMVMGMRLGDLPVASMPLRTSTYASIRSGLFNLKVIVEPGYRAFS